MQVNALNIRPKLKFPLFAWLIMLAQGMMPWHKESWSHNAIMFNFEGFIFVIDASTKSVRVVSSVHFFKRYDIVRITPIYAPSNSESFLNWLSEVLGRDYDGLQFVGLALDRLSISRDNGIGRVSKMICCELMLSYVETFCGVDLGDLDNYDLIEADKIVRSL